jgi:hypothetical protein
MIKITYKQEPYHYEHTGGQPYDIETVVTLNEDISSDEAIIAFLKVLNMATYRVSIVTLKRVIADLEYEYSEGERIL